MDRDPNHAPKHGDDEQKPTENVPFSVMFGSLKDKTTVKLTIEEINQVIADGWAGKMR